MFHWRFWLIVAMLFFGLHIVLGYVNCVQYMCPGDKEDGWVIEFVDEDTGERMIKQDGKIMPKQQWLQLQSQEKFR